MMDVSTEASKNFETHMQQNVYPGRGLVIGRSSEEDAWLIVYWIMGRSASSRNRQFVAQETTLRTEPIDTSKMTDPSLLIYEAMLELPNTYLVSNGDQTRTIFDTLQAGGTFDAALATREREPDAPHYTPRISGMLELVPTPALTLSILKANVADPERSDRFTYRPATPPAGFGYGLTTYRGDGNPLPNFSGEPLLLPTQGSIEYVLETYWHALNAENLVSLAVKRISGLDGSSRILVRNRYLA